MDIFDLAEQVRTARKAAGMTQEELARKAGLGRVRINQLEAGSLLDMRFGSVIAVLNALNLDLKISASNSGRPVFEEIQEERARDAAPEGPRF